jgi:hypothetical protein
MYEHALDEDRFDFIDLLISSSLNRVNSFFDKVS